MHQKSPFLLNDFMCNKSRKQLPIYCVKFCPYTSDYIFAAAILNKVEIYKINDEEKMIKVRTFEANRDEYFYSLDWTIDTKNNEILLIGAGELFDGFFFYKDPVKILKLDFMTSITFCCCIF